MIFEVFIDTKDDTEAYAMLSHAFSSTQGKVKTGIKKVLGQEGIRSVKRLLGKDGNI